MDSYQQRVVEEKTELDEKSKKLHAFIVTNPGFAALDEAEKDRLRQQEFIMWQYSKILGERIAAFTI